MRKRYAVVIIGTEGTAAAQKSELSRHRSEAAAREAAKAERRRLYLVRPEDVGRYMVIVEHDGVQLLTDDPEPELRAPAPGAFPLSAGSGKEPHPPAPERRVREDRLVEEEARRHSAPDSRVQRLPGPALETLRDPLPEPVATRAGAPRPASTAPAPSPAPPEPPPAAEPDPLDADSTEITGRTTVLVRDPGPVAREPEDPSPRPEPQEPAAERPDAPVRSRLDDIEVPSGRVPEEVIQRFADAVRREEERERR